MPKYYHFYTAYNRHGARELTPKEYMHLNTRNYLIAIIHEDGTINLTKGRNLITLTYQQLEKLLQLTQQETQTQ